MKILLLNQCFYPDVVSTAQHASDLVAALAERGHEVTVVAGTRAYDDPARQVSPTRNVERRAAFCASRVWPWAKVRNGAAPRTSPVSSSAAFCRLVLLPRYDVVIALTSPPLISLLGALFVKLKGGRFIFWVMDLNPDEAIAAGWLTPDSADRAHPRAALLNFSAATPPAKSWCSTASCATAWRPKGRPR